MPSKRKISQIQIDRNMADYRQKVASDVKEAATVLKAPTTAFLLQIKTELQESIDHGLSYKKIAQTIEEVFSFRVTENSVRNFAAAYLHINKRIAYRGISNTAALKEKKERHDLPQSTKREKINQLLKKAEQHSDGDEF